MPWRSSFSRHERTRRLLLRSRQRPNRNGMPYDRPWIAGPQNTSSRLMSSPAKPSVQRKHKLHRIPA